MRGVPTGQTRSQIVARSQKKLYERYALLLRKSDDAELIEYIEEKRRRGLALREIVKELWKGAKK